MVARKLFICLLAATFAAAFEIPTAALNRENAGQEKYLQALKADFKNFAAKSDEPVDEPRCPPKENIAPCTCKLTDGTIEIECSGPKVTQTSIDDTIDRTRFINNAMSTDTLKLGIMRINATELTSVNFTSFLNTEIFDFTIFDNPKLTSIKGPMMGWGCDEPSVGKINATWFTLTNSWGLTDDGFGNTLKMFDHYLKSLWITGTEIKGGRYPLSDGSGDVEYVPGLAALTNLKWLHFCYSPVVEVSGGQFKRNSKVEYFDLYGNGLLTTIGDDAFLFNDYSHKEPLTISFYGDVLTDDSFSQVNTSGLTSCRRPINLIFTNNKIKTLSEANFRPFLKANEKNTMDLGGNSVQCNSNMRWLRTNKKVYEKQVFNAVCANDNNRSVFESWKTL